MNKSLVLSTWVSYYLRHNHIAQLVLNVLIPSLNALFILFRGVQNIPAALKLFEAKMLVQFLYEAQLNPGINYEKLERVQTSFLRK